jgi:hypothetical protein
MALQPWRTGKVIRIEQQTETTRRFFIQIPELYRNDKIYCPMSAAPNCTIILIQYRSIGTGRHLPL